MSTPIDEFGDSTGSPKESTGRIRVSIACQHCRVRKIKCDGAVPCKKCSESGIICQPGAKRKKRAPSRKDQYIRELEKKLQELQRRPSNSSVYEESLDRLEDDANQASADRPILTHSALYKQGNKQLSEYQYFGASSSLSSIDASAFGPSSRSSTQHLGEETDIEELGNPGLILVTPDNDLDTNLQAVQAQLPSPEIIRDYVDQFFAYFAPQCPIINEHDFKARVVAFMRGESDNGSPPESFVSTLLMVLCFGEYIMAGNSGTDIVSQVPGWRFFLSAYSGAREGLRRANIESMQAVTLQILYLQSISKLSVAYVLLGNLIRLMQAAGMHRAQDLSTPEGVSRTNLMNFIYILEKQLALGLGRPSLIQDFDCDFHTPSPPTSDSGDTGYGNLALFVHMARIAGDVHRLLYSPEAARSSTQSYLQNVERCEGELERWRNLYLPAFPAGGLFRDESEIPPEAFDIGPGEGIRPNLVTYMYLLCSVRRAIPVSHTLSDSTKVAGMDQRGVEIAISMIKMLQLDKRPIESCQWLSIYRAFTCGTILYQSLRAKVLLKNQPFPDAGASGGATRQLNALRVLESLLKHKVRGYTGAAQFLAKVIKGWIAQFEGALMPQGSSSDTTPAPVPSQQHRDYFQQKHQGAPMGLAAQAATTPGSGSWSPTSAQHLAQYFTSTSAPLPSPNAPAAAAFSAMYSQEMPLRLSLTTATNDYQGAYNWVSPSQFAAYGYGPDPPSAVAEHTDFSGGEMFDGGGGYGTFEVEDLMMPAWMPLGAPGPGQHHQHQQQQQQQHHFHQPQHGQGQ